MALISEFLEELTENADLEAQFERAPKRVMLDYGLNAEQGLLILGGTTRELRDAIQGEVDAPVYVLRGRMV